MTVFIGDVHGKYGPYKTLLKKFKGKDTIQVGDMGVGFKRIRPHIDDVVFDQNPPYDLMVKYNSRFIRGNHDNPDVCRNHTQWIPDGHVEGDTMFIGGGLSIDASMRIEGVSWWRDEELSYGEFMEMREKYLDIKPKVMVTHDCPEIVAKELFLGHYKMEYPSRTGQAFESMWLEHKPDIWIFGHWHVRKDQVLLGTRFICLEELGTIEL